MGEIVADLPAAHSCFMAAARTISLPDPAAAWERLGFAAAQVGGMRLRFDAPRFEVEAEGLASERPDGLALVHADSAAAVAPPVHADGAAAGPPPAHPNGAVVIDHVVAITDDLRRTVDALVAAGLDLRREAPPMAFLRLGECILEVVERPGAPVGFWGLVVVVPDLATLGELVGEPKDAVQPGRRIATVRPEAGLTTALAFMTPRGSIPQPGSRA